jgi:phosphoribosylglycinamide formyltransferase-1
MKNKPQIAIFISGSGTNMVNLVTQIQKGKIRADVALVFSDRQEAPGVIKAKTLGVRTIAFGPKQFKDKTAYEREILNVLKVLKVKYVILAGYMRLIGPTLLKAYKNRMLNIHPALLPEFPGAHAIRDAHQARAKKTGATVHFVTAHVDGGPVVIQKSLQVLPGESLSKLEARIHKIEYEIYPKAVKNLVEGRLQIRGKKVIVKGRRSR